MKKHGRKISEATARYKKAVLALAIILLFGVASGSFLCALLSEDKLGEIKGAAELLMSLNKEAVSGAGIFLSALKTDFIYLFFIWAFGFSPFLIPLILIGVWLKGAKIGFLTAALTRLFDLKGLAVSAALTAFPNALLIPLLIFTAVSSIHRAVKFREIKRSKNKALLRKEILKSFKSLLIVLLGAMLCAAAELASARMLLPLV